MAGHCKAGLQAITDIYADPVKRAKIAEMISDGCGPAEFVARLTADLPLDDQQLLLAEFVTLPDSFTRSVMAVWVDATELGDSFDIENVPLSLGQSLHHARNGIVDWHTRHDNDGFHMTISHVPGHHAESLKASETVAT